MVVLKHCYVLLTSKFKLQQNETEMEVFTSPSPFKISAEQKTEELQSTFLSSKSIQTLPEVFLANPCFLTTVDIKLSLSKSCIS